MHSDDSEIYFLHAVMFSIMACMIVFLSPVPPPRDHSIAHSLEVDSPGHAVRLIHQGYDVNSTNSNGILAIELAMDLPEDEDVYYVLKHLSMAGASLFDVPESKRKTSEAWQAAHREYEEYWKHILETGGHLGLWDWIKNASVAAVEEMLQAQQFDLNDMDFYGEQPLHAALKYDNIPVACYFLDSGADIYKRDANGRSVPDLVLDGKDPDLIRALSGAISRDECCCCY